MQRYLQYFLGAILTAPLNHASAQTSPAAANQPETGRAVQPVPQAYPLFLAAHKALLEKKNQGVIDVYFLGDSITRRWQGTDYPEHKKNWDHNFHGWNAANFGWGGDSIQNVLWRLQHGELDGVNPKAVVLMIGTNNLGSLRPSDETAAKTEEVVRGIRTLINIIREKAPAAKVVLMGITPRRDQNGVNFKPVIARINSQLRAFADGNSIAFLNINDKLTDREGNLLKGVTEDGLHLSVEGYQIWADALKPLFTQWLGPPAPIDRSPPASGVPTAGPIPPEP
jgi:lysophospholipase L1-like esterase